MGAAGRVVSPSGRSCVATSRAVGSQTRVEREKDVYHDVYPQSLGIVGLG